MTRDECAKVLAKIQLGDNRSVDLATLEEWFDTIGHLDFPAAIAAVRLHRQESTAYLQPAHVIAGARRVQETQAPPRELPSPGSCTHRWKAYLAGGETRWLCVHCGQLGEP